MDKLDFLIADRREQLADLEERQLRMKMQYETDIAEINAACERLAIELRAFEVAAEARPGTQNGSREEREAKGQPPDTKPEIGNGPAHGTPRSTGRQRGAIDKKWRRTLQDVYASGNLPCSPERINVIA